MRKHLVPGSVAALLAATGLASAEQQPAPADTASVQSGSFSLGNILSPYRYDAGADCALGSSKL